jgi:hypothetical protein
MFSLNMNHLLTIECATRRYCKPGCCSQVARSEILVLLGGEFALSLFLVLSSLGLILSCLASRPATKTLYIQRGHAGNLNTTTRLIQFAKRLSLQVFDTATRCQSACAELGNASLVQPHNATLLVVLFVADTPLDR